MTSLNEKHLNVTFDTHDNTPVTQSPTLRALEHVRHAKLVVSLLGKRISELKTISVSNGDSVCRRKKFNTIFSGREASLFE